MIKILVRMTVCLHTPQAEALREGLRRAALSHAEADRAAAWGEDSSETLHNNIKRAKDPMQYSRQHPSAMHRNLIMTMTLSLYIAIHASVLLYYQAVAAASTRRDGCCPG